MFRTSQLFNFVLLWTLPLLTRAQCSAGSFNVEVCGSVGETTIVNGRISDECYWRIIAYWGDYSESIVVNRTELERDDPDSDFSLADYSLEHNYTEPGLYELEFVVEGYTNYSNMLEGSFQIRVEKASTDMTTLSVEDDSCEKLSDSGAASTWSLAVCIAALLISLAWIYM